LAAFPLVGGLFRFASPRSSDARSFVANLRYGVFIVSMGQPRRSDQRGRRLRASCRAIFAFGRAGQHEGVAETVAVLGWSIAILSSSRFRSRSTTVLAAYNPDHAQYNLDRVQGTFIGMGAGHHVLGALALFGALWLVQSFALRPRWLKWPLAALLASLVVLSDSKQPILAVFLAFIVLRARKVRSAAHAVKLAGQVVLLLAGIYAVLRRFGTHGYFHEIPTVVQGFINKFTVFSILVENFHSWTNWIFGVGPGHGVSRMGGWLIDHYWDVLEPLGATRTDVAQQAWRASEPYLHRSSFSRAAQLGRNLRRRRTGRSLVMRRFCGLRTDALRRRVFCLLLLATVFLGFFFEWLEA
jgi:hypothetical protein